MAVRAVVLPIGVEDDGYGRSAQPYLTDIHEDAAIGLEQMQKVVGGYIEPVEIIYSPPGSDGFTDLMMWVNENGKIDGLEANIRASAFAKQIIHGQVLITGPIVGENETEVPEDIAQAILTDKRSWQDMYSDTIKSLADADQGGPYVMMCMGNPGQERPSQGKQNVAGQFLQSYDPEYHGGEGHAVWTRDLSQAQRFATKVEAAVLYRTIPESKPTRPDGQENRPLTAFSIEIMNLNEAIQLRVLYYHLPEDGDHRKRSMRDMN